MTTLSDFLKVDGVDYPLAEYFNFLYSAALRAEMTNTETITVTKELTDNDVQFQVITASGGNREVELAPEAATNHVTIIENGGSSNHVVVKDDSGAVTFATLAPGDWILCFPVFGKTWRFIKSRTEEWIEVRETWAYASATTITVPTDATTRYQKSDRIRFKQGGGYKYFYATAVTATVLTANGGSDFTVANSAITDIAYSRSASPLGFPTEFNWSPAPTNLTIGNGTMTAKFKMIGMEVHFHWEFVFGSTSSVGGNVTFVLPIAIAGYGGAGILPVGLTRYKDATGGNANSGVAITNAGAGQLIVLNAAGTYAVQDVLSSTVPFTWATSDEIDAEGSYFA